MSENIVDGLAILNGEKPAPDIDLQIIYSQKPMPDKKILQGVVHEVPEDLHKTLTADAEVLELWESLTPLARNEWICWVISSKKEETRKEHIQRVASELKEGMRRPCCWIGCIHRTDKAISPSVKGILSKRSKI